LAKGLKFVLASGKLESVFDWALRSSDDPYWAAAMRPS